MRVLDALDTAGFTCRCENLLTSRQSETHNSRLSTAHAINCVTAFSVTPA